MQPRLRFEFWKANEEVNFVLCDSCGSPVRKAVKIVLRDGLTSYISAYTCFNCLKTFFKDLLNMNGLEKVSLILFKLPSEHRNSKTKTLRVNGKVLMERVFSKNFSKLRYLRRAFYTKLHKIAYRSELGWILSENNSNFNGLNEVVEKMSKTVGEKVFFKVVDVYVPREFIEREPLQELTENHSFNNKNNSKG